MTVQDASLLAKDLFAQGRYVEAIELCNQIVAHDASATLPYLIAHQACVLDKNWPMAIETGLYALHTRPEYEIENGFETAMGVTHQEFIQSLIRACDGLGETDDKRVSALALLARDVTEQASGNFDTARTHYTQLLNFGSGAERLVGEAINLLHALEYQVGNPEAAKQWIDLDRFPIQLHASDLYTGDDFSAFCAGVFQEVFHSPLLNRTTDQQSRGWIVGDELNAPGCGPYVKELEGLFRNLLARHQDAFTELRLGFVHPVFQTFPEVHTIKMFCAMLLGAGHVGPHHHNDGFLVGNMYVHVPIEPDGAEDNRACVEFGKHLFHGVTGSGYPTRRIVPEMGLMLMWPAYYCHNVPPSHAASPRMAVGFDLVPGTMWS